MAESTARNFVRLFEIRLLHHYWLDSGANIFDSLPEARQQQLLAAYDIRSFLSIAPLSSTQKKFKGLGCRFIETGLGCVVGLPEDKRLAENTTFEFEISIVDASFYNYTTLTLLPQKIFTSGIHRFKENVPLFSNMTGASRGTGASKSLFLSREIPSLADGDKVEAIYRSGEGALMQLTADQPAADSQELSTSASSVPVFANQADIPAINISGIVGAPARGISLSKDIPDRAYALVSIRAKRPDDSDFDIIDGSGSARTTSPVFQIRFKNRSTVWKYFNKHTSALLSIESNPLPLTRWGNAGTQQKPESLIKAEQNGDRITKIVSEIYV